MLVALYSVAILVSAALLFFVEPMYARYLLPRLGSAPSVWNTALVFYQAALLAGYAYAHVATKWLGVRRQAVLHLALLALPFLFLPIGLAADALPPTSGSPAPWVLVTMATTVGVPFFVVSATSPLLQRWFSELGHQTSHDPYFLYAASNVGSMVGLFAYPLLIEPSLTLKAQSNLWTGSYLLLVALMAASAFALWRRNGAKAADPTPEPASASDRLASPTPLRKARWVMLAFVPSSLMMGVTTFIATDVASIPLLWAIPLALYLLTFTIAFSKRRFVPHHAMVLATPPLLLAGLVAMVGPVANPVWLLVTVGLLGFFVSSLACHGELAADRPSPEHLTEFFLLTSLGGVLGGAFCGLLAPVAFKSVLEYPITLVLCAAVLPKLANADGRRQALGDWLWPAGVVALALAGYGALQAFHLNDDHSDSWMALALPAVLALAAMDRPKRLALSCAALAVVGLWQGGLARRTVFESRGFFGALRVSNDFERNCRAFYHGTTLHGTQSLDPVWAKKPISYYFPTGPIGEVFAKRPLPPNASIAIVGLGVGSLTAYAQPGQTWTVYEIDPKVVEVARNPRLFTYLRDAKAPIEIVLGDARLSLARSTRVFDLIVLDAYSSDSIPIHLMTREALRVYLNRLKPGGIIAFHLSNRHLDLEPVTANLARDAGLCAIVRWDGDMTDEESRHGKQPSQWALVARRRADLNPMVKEAVWTPPATLPGLRTWTDDYSSVVGVLRMLGK